MLNSHIEKLVESSLNAFNGSKRAEPKPYLLTRVMAAVNSNAIENNFWSNAIAFISRPKIVLASLFIIIFINTGIILFNTNNFSAKPDTVQGNAVPGEEFAINAGFIYDIENQ